MDVKLVSWLFENIRPCSAEFFLDFNEIKAQLPESLQITSTKFSKLVKKTFRNVHVKYSRNLNDWAGKKVSRYYGIYWNDNKENDKEILFSSISESLPSGFFVTSRAMEYIQIGHFLDVKVNENRVMVEILLKNDLTCSFSCLGKAIQPETIGTTSSFSLTFCKLNALFESVRNMHLCAGQESNEPDMFENAYNEIVQVKNQSPIKRSRSTSCVICIPYKSKYSVCRKCQQLELRKKENEKIDDQTCNDEEVNLCEKDHKDLTIILNEVFPNCPKHMLSFLQAQKNAVEKHPNGRRWDKNIVRLCLSLWCRSPRAYTDLRKSGFMMLPSEHLLRIYKNTVKQEAGLSKEVLQWMANEAKLKNLCPDDYIGGLLIDEMAIQPDLQFSMSNGSIELVGFKEIMPETVVMDEIKSKRREVTLATHVLQLVFLGLNGFRFPIAHYPTCSASGHELYFIIWKAINMLSMFGFKVQYISTDGAQSNRDLLHLLIPNFTSSNPGDCSFQNIYCSDKNKIFFIMDCSHVFKKIRNNLCKSGYHDQASRCIKLNQRVIVWEHLRKAYEWDISTNPFPIHQRLTHEHFSLSNEAKMRNHLAEDVLNSEMHHLLCEYQKALGVKGSELDSTIELLKNTSALIKIFRDPRLVFDFSDDRLRELGDILNFFIEWEKSVIGDKSIKSPEKALISKQTREDTVSCIAGFIGLCNQRLKTSAASIVPSRINSDVIENMFCQQRTLHNGSNSNPTYLGYCRMVNSVILGQTSISRKSNAGSGMNSATHLFPVEKMK